MIQTRAAARPLPGLGLVASEPRPVAIAPSLSFERHPLVHNRALLVRRSQIIWSVHVAATIADAARWDLWGWLACAVGLRGVESLARRTPEQRVVATVSRFPTAVRPSSYYRTRPFAPSYTQAVNAVPALLIVGLTAKLIHLLLAAPNSDGAGDVALAVRCGAR